MRHLSQATGTPACNRRPAHPATLPGLVVRVGLGRRAGEPVTSSSNTAFTASSRQSSSASCPATSVKTEEGTCSRQGTGLSLCHLLKPVTRGTLGWEPRGSQPLCKDCGKPAET